MANVTAYDGSAIRNYKGADRVYTVEQYINLGTSNYTLTDSIGHTGQRVIAPAQSTGIATGDVILAISVPAKTKVMDVVVETIVAANKVATATVGDGDGANSWDGSTNLAATAGTQTHAIGGTDAYATQGGKLYTAADTIDLTCTVTSGPITSGVIKVSAILADMS